MQAIVKYRSLDGSEWKDEVSAVKRDSLHLLCEAAMAPLGEVPEAVKDGKGWLQHDPETVTRCKQLILDLCKEEGYGKHFKAFNEPAEKVHPLSIVGRVLSDDNGPLSTAWNRFSRIDAEGREHQQCLLRLQGGPVAGTYLHRRSMHRDAVKTVSSDTANERQLALTKYGTTNPALGLKIGQPLTESCKSIRVELTACQLDAKRLEAVVINHWRVYDRIDAPIPDARVYNLSNEIVGRGQDFRTAIDQAVSSQKP